MDQTNTKSRPLLTEKQAADYLGMTPRFLQARRYRGGGPPFVRISHTAVRYRPEDLDEWLDERTYKSTAEASESDG